SAFGAGAPGPRGPAQPPPPPPPARVPPATGPLPSRGLPRRHRRLWHEGDRRHHGTPDRDGPLAGLPGPPPAARPPPPAEPAPPDRTDLPVNHPTPVTIGCGAPKS